MIGIKAALAVAGIVAVASVACGGGSEPGSESGTWRLQVGSEQSDTSYGISAAPNGDAVIAAATEGSLAGENQGQRDIYLARYSRTGELRWAWQDGGPKNDSPLGVSVAPDGSIYVGGFTEGDFASPNQGSADVWLARFDPDGNELWRRQFGGPAWDRGFDVSAYDGGAYITGYTSSSLDSATDLGGFDGFAAKFDADGNRQWIRHIGTDATDWGQGSALAPDGGLYVTGYTEGDLDGINAGDKDLFAVRLRPDGSQVWATQLGTSALDWTQGVGLGPEGGVLLAGSTEGSFAADHAGDRDMLVVWLDDDGNEQWRWQWGTEGNDSAFEIRQVGEQFVISGSNEGEGMGKLHGTLLRLDPTGKTSGLFWSGSLDRQDFTGLDVAADGSVFWSGHTLGSHVQPNAGDFDLFFGLAWGPGE